MIHNFNAQFYFAREKEGALDAIYRNYFKNVSSIERGLPLKREHYGIDSIIHLDSGEQIRTQEKWRKREFTDDFLIEYCSVERKGTCQKPGWIYHIYADYLFAVYEPSERVKVYPVVQLKLAWNEYSFDWIQQFSIPPARNDTYLTRNVAVPCNILENAIREVMTFDYQRRLLGVVS